jgi:hypothetical protein
MIKIKMKGKEGYWSNATLSPSNLHVYQDNYKGMMWFVH